MIATKTIEPFLVAAGKALGVKGAYPYRLSDPTSRTQEPYFTYRVKDSGASFDNPILRNGKEDDYTAVWGVTGTHETVVDIRIHRDPNGMHVLSQIAMMAQKIQPLINIFSRNNCAFRTAQNPEDLTPDENSASDGDLHDQIVQKIEFVFYDEISVQYRERNGIVETVTIDLGL